MNSIRFPSNKIHERMTPEKKKGNVMNANSIGSIFLFLCVLLSALSSHFFKPFFLAHPDKKEIYALATQQFFWHSVGLFFFGFLQNQYPSFFSQGRFKKYPFYAFLIGIFLFCGGLFLYCFTDNPLYKKLSPLGGFFFLSGWLYLAYLNHETRKHKR